MTWISFFTTSYQKHRRRQTDAGGDKRTQMHTNTQTSEHTHGHDERCQLLSAIRQCIFPSRSNISRLGEKYSLCFCSKWPCKCTSVENCVWAPLLFISCGVALTVVSIELFHRDVHQVLYLFFLRPGFDDLRCQSETRGVLNTFVHLAKTTP